MRLDYLALILSMAIVTFATRIAGIVALRRAPAGWMPLRVLRYIPVAMLTSLVVGAVLMPGGRLHFSLKNEYLLAGLVCCAAAHLTRNVLATVAVGIAAVLGLRALLGG